MWIAQSHLSWSYSNSGKRCVRWAQLPLPLLTAPPGPDHKTWISPGLELAPLRPNPPSQALGFPWLPSHSGSRWEDVIISDLGAFSAWIVVVGSPLLLTAREGPAHSQGLTWHPPSSHSRTSFFFFLSIGNPAWSPKHLPLCPSPDPRVLLEMLSTDQGSETLILDLTFHLWDKCCPLPNILSNWHSMPRALSVWITSSLAIFMWLSPPMWISVPSGLQLPAPTRSGQSQWDWPEGLWPRFSHPERQLQGSKGSGCLVEPGSSGVGVLLTPHKKMKKRKAQCIDRLGWGQVKKEAQERLRALPALHWASWFSV